MEKMRNEERFLLLCSRVDIQESDVKLLREMASHGLDWQYLLRIAVFHRVFPLLYHNIIKTLPDDPPEHILRQLKEKVIQNGAKNLFLVSQLISLLNLLRENGVQALTFKGPVLAEDIFGNVGFRSFNDLDLLISHGDLKRAVSLLEGKGFCQDIDLSPEQYEKLVAKGHHATLLKDGVIVELHWELTGRYFRKEVDFDSLLPRAEQVVLAGGKASTLGAEDLLIYLCIHGCRHYWFQLDAVCCVAELVKKKVGLDWGLLFRRAQEFGALKMVGLGLLLTRQLLGLALPAEVEMLPRYPKLEKSACDIAGRIFASTEFSESQMSFREYVTYHHGVMDRTSDWLSYCIRPLLNPTHSDWLWIRLPASLSLFYYVLRPLRLAGKYARKLFR
jgi:Uncharacterised nucleotidyltransferase